MIKNYVLDLGEAVGADPPVNIILLPVDLQYLIGTKKGYLTIFINFYILKKI